MKNRGIYLLLFLLLMQAGFSQEIFQSPNTRISFFSSAPVEDIEAVSKQGTSVYNSVTGEIIFRVRIRSFNFAKSLMEEHFNENYMESHKYPHATFRGKLSPIPNTASNEIQTVMILGDLEIHGKVKNRNIPAEVRFVNKEMHLNSNFGVANKDHNIKIPRLMFRNIAEVIKVTVEATYNQ
ncbi:YceI family protein [Antarcticibacterium arcticum]|uniref:YceI family protein n=1 Tax=Antarcticibacterium arcticum TaxID=2585771 RepID=A0A5B8YNA1_9FLAO|nr:YceI family protein [Antarcticibacterium arcticum]QED38971.1 YceI family protein [Antarcticibacterium arcticum]